MHLLSVLAAGVSGAENGTVDVYRRGTTTRVPIYSDAEATSSVTPTAALALDQNGRLIGYVNESVDVVCKDAQGTTICEFTTMAAAPLVEYQGQSFTGQNYVTAASGAGTGYPTTAQAIFDLWKTSAGAKDFKVLVSGVEYNIDDALSLFPPIYFNVKALTYDAKGDGATDDTTAISAAVAAASAAGGGVVFFPAGNYRITSAITLPDKVSLLGAGAGGTLIGIDHATANVFTVSSSVTNERQFIAGMSIGPLQSNSGTHISVTASRGLLIRDCTIGSGNTNTTGKCVNVAADAATQVVIDNCKFTPGGSSSFGVNVAGAAKRVQIRACLFVLPASFSGNPVVGDHIDLVDCVFDGSATTSGTFSYFTAKSTTLDATLVGCQFLAGGGATVTAMTLGTYTSSSNFMESGSFFGSAVTAYSYVCDVTVSANSARVDLRTRESRATSVTSTSGTVTLPTDQYGTVWLNNTFAGNVTFTPVQPPGGAQGQVIISNANGVNRDFTPAAPFVITTLKTIVATTGQNRLIYHTLGLVAVNSDPTMVNYWAA